MKIQEENSHSLPFQKDDPSSPVQGSDVNEHLNLASLRRIRAFRTQNLRSKWIHSVVKIFRRITTCNFFYTNFNWDKFSSEERNGGLTPHYNKELRTLELTIALVQINRDFVHK